ncbi:hypothetical protein IVA78_27220 [Bradyrhizobium sp. 137]|uniref:hypothetical protein n=1 Tax=Bradyrhizobium sp. 137 TaxID=2782614 RepID=UPI001FF7FCDD|nr:hypothetical protein [Bradyrhizobium sp. 137]MCK1758762.1 hypothetical protein [Bradyrhizobium sp. 137]
MSTAAARRLAPANETTKAADKETDRDNIAPLRVRDLNKVYRDSYGLVLPPSDDGRYAAHVWLVHTARTGAGAEQRMDSFLEFRAHWMSIAERSAAKEAAFASTKFWGADELAFDFAITYAKRTALGLTTIGSIDVDAAGRKAIRKEKQREREQRRRLRERLRRKPDVTAAARRADAIGQMLPPGEWIDVRAICGELGRGKTIAFGRLTGKTLAAAVHRAIEHGISEGWLQKRVLPGPKMPIAQIAKRSAR